MTKKDFEMIAKVLRDSKPDCCEAEEREQWSDVVFNFMKCLQKTNPRFDWKRFLAACGMDH